MVGHDVDLCKAIAAKLGVTAKTRLSRSRRACPRFASAASTSPSRTSPTRSAAPEQIQFSDPYYLAKEMLAVKASDPGTSKADFKGKRLASTKGSTSELSIR